MFKIIVILGIVLTSWGNTLLATEKPTPIPMSIVFKGGYSDAKGILGSSENNFIWGVTHQIGRGDQNEIPWSSKIDELLLGFDGFFSTEIQSSTMDSSREVLGFTSGEKSITLFPNFSLAFCALAKLPVHICLGTGYTALNLSNGSTTRFNFFAQTFSAGVEVELYEKIYLICDLSWLITTMRVENQNKDLVLANRFIGIGFGF